MATDDFENMLDFEDFEDFVKKIFGNTPNGSEKTGTIKPGSEKLNTTRPDDNISHPNHYTFGKVESIDLMESVEGRQAVADFCICNCWKYLYRHKHKNNDISDIRKLVWYANKYIELMGGNTDDNSNECRIYERCLIRVGDLEAENAELRELVKNMWFADYAGHFSTLPEHQDHQAAVWKRMRELGIEVDK